MVGVFGAFDEFMDISHYSYGVEMFRKGFILGVILMVFVHRFMGEKSDKSVFQQYIINQFFGRITFYLEGKPHSGKENKAIKRENWKFWWDNDFFQIRRTFFCFLFLFFFIFTHRNPYPSMLTLIWVCTFFLGIRISRQPFLQVDEVASASMASDR